MIRLLFVCTGNICRSPTAEGIARDRIERQGLTGEIEVDSAGIEGYHRGQPPDPRACRVARRHGIDIAGLRARPVRESDFERFDLILALDRGHRALLLRQCPPLLASRIALLMRFAANGGDIDVPDPYHHEIGVFEQAYTLIESGVTGVLEHARAQWMLGAQGSLFGT